MARGAAWLQWMGVSKAMGEPARRARRVQLCYQAPRTETPSGHSLGLRTVGRDRRICTVGIAWKRSGGRSVSRDI